MTGSNFARERHLAWTWNLLAHADVCVEIKSRRIDVTARPVPDEEREATWVLLERNWPGYRGYERAAGREFGSSGSRRALNIRRAAPAAPPAAAPPRTP